MNIHGKERGFRLTVGASQEIAALCPDGDLARISELLGGGFETVTDGVIAIIEALSKGEEEALSYERPGYEPAPLTAAEIRTLTFRELKEVEKAAIDAFVADYKPSVEVEPEKSKKKTTEETP